MKTLLVDQGTDEWKVARLGKITGSRASRLMGGAKTRESLFYELLTEIVTGKWEDGYTSAAMEYGTVMEPFARNAYMMHTDAMVHEVGFVEYSDYFGVSPDGLIYLPADEWPIAGVEIKCPNTKTHLEYILKGGLPAKYRWQVLALILCCDLDYVDFVSYDARLPEKNQLFIHRCFADEYSKDIKNLESEIRSFSEKLQKAKDRFSV